MATNHSLGITSHLPLVVIVGPTASGKTALAVEIAEKINGEIICADSRTVYKELDIGSAKPSDSERVRVPHWGIDLIKPNGRFTVADFKSYAIDKIEDIRSRGRVPFLVGGTGLYIDSVLFDYEFGPHVDGTLRRELESMTLSELHEYSINNNIPLPENFKNKRYVIRAIEQKSVNSKRRTKPIDNTIIVGITTEREALGKRLRLRINQMLDDGVVEEATALSRKYGWNNEAMTGNIYPVIHLYLENKISLSELEVISTTRDRRLAKKQITWFKRNAYIHWDSPENLRDYLFRVLAKS